MKTLDKIKLGILERRGWRSGTSLEDHVTLLLSGAFRADEVKQQHRIGRYKADYAWPDVKVVLEVDGWHHRSSEGAAKDAERDSTLRADGWLVLRVDDRNGVECMLDQAARVGGLVWSLRGRSGPSPIATEHREAARRPTGFPD